MYKQIEQEVKEIKMIEHPEELNEHSQPDRPPYRSKKMKFVEME